MYAQIKVGGLMNGRVFKHDTPGMGQGTPVVSPVLFSCSVNKA